MTRKQFNKEWEHFLAQLKGATYSCHPIDGLFDEPLKQMKNHTFAMQQGLSQESFQRKLRWILSDVVSLREDLDRLNRVEVRDVNN